MFVNGDGGGSGKGGYGRDERRGGGAQGDAKGVGRCTGACVSVVAVRMRDSVTMTHSNILEFQI